MLNKLLYPFLLIHPNKDKIVRELQASNIEVRPIYPNLEGAKYLNINENFVNSKKFEQKGVVLPCGPDQSFQDLKRVISVIKKWEKINIKKNK